MPLKLQFRSSPSKLGDIAIVVSSDGLLPIPKGVVLVQVGASGGSGDPNSPNGENATVREHALKLALRQFHSDSTLLWYQQGAYAQNPHVVCQRRLGDLLASDEPSIKVGDNHAKWLAIEMPSGFPSEFLLDVLAAPDLKRTPPPPEMPEFEWLDPTTERLRIAPVARGVLLEALRDSAAQPIRPFNPEFPNDINLDSDAESPLRSTRMLILEGVPGTGKSHEITRVSKSGFAQPITTIVMHPAIGYEDMIEGVRPTAGGFESGANLNPKPGAKWFYECFGEDASRTPSGTEPPFGVRAGQFLLACARACKDPERRFLIVLDEINRCNVPRAFGELLLSIEASKRWHWKEGTKKWEGDSPSVTLPYSGLQFFVPDNLYILGTMNTSDRSVAPLDQALRRRFAFHRLEPMSPADLKQALDGFGASALVGSAIDCWHALNKTLEAELGADMMLGHSYFFDAKRLREQGSEEAEALRSTWRYSLLPQLFEILHIANRIELAQFGELSRHLGALGLEIESPRATGMHAMLRVKERSGANGAT